MGSSPIRVAICWIREKSRFYIRFASVAQLVEQGTENPRVSGSIPLEGTISCWCSSIGRAADL